MINITKVTKVFGKKTVLREVSMQVKQGEVFGLLGPNGAGKSTLLSILSTVLMPTSGTVTINNLSIEKDKKKVRHLIGYVPQDIALLEDLTVKENLLFWSKFSKVPVSKDDLYELCATVHVTDKWDEKVSHLSGGMKRKVNIITSLIHNPDVLFMDEPTVGIDLESKLEINHYIANLAKAGKTIVYITHDMSEILHLCDRFAMLKEGTVQFVGSMADARFAMEKKGMQLESDEALVYQMLKH